MDTSPRIRAPCSSRPDEKARAHLDWGKSAKTQSKPDTKGKSSSRLDARPKFLEHVLLVAPNHCFWTCVAASCCPGEEFLWKEEYDSRYNVTLQSNPSVFFCNNNRKFLKFPFTCTVCFPSPDNLAKASLQRACETKASEQKAQIKDST